MPLQTSVEPYKTLANDDCLSLSYHTIFMVGRISLECVIYTRWPTGVMAAILFYLWTNAVYTVTQRTLPGMKRKVQNVETFPISNLSADAVLTFAFI